MARPKGETGLWKKKFIESLEMDPQVSKACRKSGVTRSTAYKAYHKAEDDPEDDFNLQWDNAMETGLDQYEEDLISVGRGERKGNVTAFIYMLNVRRYQKRQDTDMPAKLTLEWGSDGKV